MATGTGTGAPATGGTTTFVQLLDRVATAVDDLPHAHYTTAALAAYLNDAVRDYTQHFPRLRRHDLTTVADQRRYDLPADCLALLTVEYPQGQDPPRYLRRRSHHHPTFWRAPAAYDLLPRADQTTPGQLLISPQPPAGHTIRLEYHAHHALITNTAAVSGHCTVPAHHEHLLLKYVLWQCSLQLQMAEQQTPTSSSSLLMAQLAANARRLRQDYDQALRQAIFAAEGAHSAPVSWANTAPETTRIY